MLNCNDVKVLFCSWHDRCFRSPDDVRSDVTRNTHNCLLSRYLSDCHSRTVVFIPTLADDCSATGWLLGSGWQMRRGWSSEADGRAASPPSSCRLPRRPGPAHRLPLPVAVCPPHSRAFPSRSRTAVTGFVQGVHFTGSFRVHVWQGVTKGIPDRCPSGLIGCRYNCHSFPPPSLVTILLIIILLIIMTINSFTNVVLYSLLHFMLFLFFLAFEW